MNLLFSISLTLWNGIIILTTKFSLLHVSLLYYIPPGRVPSNSRTSKCGSQRLLLTYCRGVQTAWFRRRCSDQTSTTFFGIKIILSRLLVVCARVTAVLTGYLQIFSYPPKTRRNYRIRSALTSISGELLCGREPFRLQWPATDPSSSAKRFSAQVGARRDPHTHASNTIILSCVRLGMCGRHTISR